jgi:hypothetical protein
VGGSFGFGDHRRSRGRSKSLRAKRQPRADTGPALGCSTAFDHNTTVACTCGLTVACGIAVVGRRVQNPRDRSHCAEIQAKA